MADTATSNRPSVTSTSGLSVSKSAGTTDGLSSDHGATTIADTVVSKIAGIAARDISGVHALG
ncbi:Asp23/Gls24 family envelope stress response protein, partial [Kineococcus sp. NPDC059986]